MHSIRDIQNHFGWSEWQARSRLGYLRDTFKDCAEGSQGAKLWVTDKGFRLLERLRELEKQGHNTKSAIKVIKKELSKQDTDKDTGDPKPTKTNQEIIQLLKNEILFLRGQLEAKDKQIQSLLPGTNSKGLLKRIFDKIW